MLPDGMGLPSVEVRFLIEGDEVAVVAFFVDPAGGVDVVVGIDDADSAPHVARTLEAAAKAVRSANWKAVRLGGEGSVPFDVDGQGSYPSEDSSDERTRGDVSSEAQFPF